MGTFLKYIFIKPTFMQNA